MFYVTIFSDWLQLKFEEWERSKGRRRISYAEFARYLEVSAPSLNRWLMGDVEPAGENVYKLADKLGYEIYDILDVQPPTSRFVHEIDVAYNALPSEIQPKFQQDYEKFLTEWLVENGFKREK